MHGGTDGRKVITIAHPEQSSGELKILCRYIAIDKRGYPHNIFLISQRIHTLWVLIRSASLRRFQRVPQH